jgi:hypothetical protein
VKASNGDSNSTMAKFIVWLSTQRLDAFERRCVLHVVWRYLSWRDAVIATGGLPTVAEHIRSLVGTGLADGALVKTERALQILDDYFGEVASVITAGTEWASAL